MPEPEHTPPSQDNPNQGVVRRRVYQTNRPKETRPLWRAERTGRPYKKLITIGICTLLVLIMIAIPIRSWQNRQSLGEDPTNVIISNQQEESSEKNQKQGLFGRLKRLIFTEKTTLSGEKDDRINIILLGIGGPGHDGPYLTDTIILASIKPSTKEIAMVSIPRDLGVEIPGAGLNKINHVNALAEARRKNSGGAAVADLVAGIFELPIHYYIRVDFSAFSKLIDEVGGLTIDVEKSFTDKEYPGPNFTYQTVSFVKGQQTMSGDRALIYSRSRHGSAGEGSDFARARRQQQVILALKEKLLSFETIGNPIKLKEITETLDSHILTNLDFGDIVNFLAIARDFSGRPISTLVLSTDGQDAMLESYIAPSGAYLLKPKTGNLRDIGQLIKNIFTTITPLADNTPTQSQEKPDSTIEIRNGTGQGGLASQVSETLTKSGFSVKAIGNALSRPYRQTGLYLAKNNADSATVSALSLSLKIPMAGELPASEGEAKAAIVLILGEDYPIATTTILYGHPNPTGN